MTVHPVWEAIEGFEFDDPDAEQPFSSRLAEATGWSPEAVRGAIGEYRRFLYLAVTCDHPVVPSRIIDEVWHRHLLDTRSYWDDLCRGVLGRPLHHHPSPGGRAAWETGQANYDRTLTSYCEVFGRPSNWFWPWASAQASELPIQCSNCGLWGYYYSERGQDTECSCTYRCGCH